MNAIIDFIVQNPLFSLIGTVTLIQVVPIKINPWSWLASQIRKMIVGDLENKLNDLQEDFIDEKINTKRWNVLDFANSCRQERRHTKEEWEHCISELTWYENYCENHHVSNGVMTECAKYLRESYQEHLRNNDFL